MRFLVVEDNCLVAWSLEWAMTHRGHDVVGPAVNVDVAERLLDQSLDGAVLDVKLSDLGDVSSIAQQLRKAGVPFVVHSGQAPEALPAACASAVCISKPAEPDQVVEALEALVMRNAGH